MPHPLATAPSPTRFPRAAFAVLALFMLNACQHPSPAPVPQQVPKLGMANPASVYCLQQGGQLVMAQQATGIMGMCHLPNGTVIEEWALFRRDHPSK